jgi:hypothetical protein
VVDVFMIGTPGGAKVVLSSPVSSGQITTWTGRSSWAMTTPTYSRGWGEAGDDLLTGEPVGCCGRTNGDLRVRDRDRCSAGRTAQDVAVVLWLAVVIATALGSWQERTCAQQFRELEEEIEMRVPRP